jgi:hypothetical protein
MLGLVSGLFVDGSVFGEDIRLVDLLGPILCSSIPTETDSSP